jgi:hypothetical protein
MIQIVIVLVVIIIIIIIIIFILERTYYLGLSTDSVYIKFISYNIKILHCHQIYNCRLINNI